MKYLSSWEKRKISIEEKEDNLIKSAMYEPNEFIIFRGVKLLINYALVRDGVLTYLCHGKKNSYYVAESDLLSSDQI